VITCVQSVKKNTSLHFLARCAATVDRWRNYLRHPLLRPCELKHEHWSTLLLGELKVVSIVFGLMSGWAVGQLHASASGGYMPALYGKLRWGPQASRQTEFTITWTQLYTPGGWHSTSRQRLETPPAEKPDWTSLVKPRFLTTAEHMDRVESTAAEHDPHQHLIHNHRQYPPGHSSTNSKT